MPEISDTTVAIVTLKTAIEEDVDEEMVKRAVVYVIALLGDIKEFDAKKYAKVMMYAAKEIGTTPEKVLKIMQTFATHMVERVGKE